MKKLILAFLIVAASVVTAVKGQSPSPTPSQYVAGYRIYFPFVLANIDANYVNRLAPPGVNILLAQEGGSAIRFDCSRALTTDELAALKQAFIQSIISIDQVY